MEFFPIDVLRTIYEYDSTYHDVMANVIADINNGIGAEVLGIDGSDQWQYSRTALFGIHWYRGIAFVCDIWRIMIS